MYIEQENSSKTNDTLSIKEASIWASSYTGKNVTASNISYLIQYGRIKKIGDNGSTQVSQTDLQNYYQSYNGAREVNIKEKPGNTTDIKIGDCREVLKEISDNFIDLIVTSPPYADRRKNTYGGITPEKYVE
jgi:hypothetical protein